METMDREAFLALTSAHPQNGAVQWARRAGRSLLRLRIYQERNPDSNPYYPKNEILRRCIAALEEIVAATGPKDCRGPERELLESCYRTSLELALEAECESIAFPLISSGVYGYPKAQALQVAMETVSRFLLEHDIMVYIVIFDRSSYQISEKLFADITAYIDQRYVDEHTDGSVEQARRHRIARESMESGPLSAEYVPFAAAAAPPPLSVAHTLEETLRHLDAGFSQTLLRLIDQSGMSDAQCYKKANIDRKLFSKIRSNPNYRPSKPTVLAFAVALELSLEETEALLRRAGFALSHASKFDIIVEYFIMQSCYDVFTINEALFAFDQPLLGG